LVKTLLLNSLLVSGLATLLSAGFGLLTALWAAGLEPRWRSRLIAIAAMALALPPFLVTNCWLHYLGTTGVWHGWLHLDIVSFGGAVWLLALLTWPITFLSVLSAWGRLQPAQLECDAAVTGWWLFRGLLFPAARSALANAGVLTFVLALNNFSVPALLQVKIFPAEVWVRFNTTFDTLGALKLSWPLVVGPLLLLLWFVRHDLSWPRLEGAVPAKLFRQQLGPVWSFLSGAGALAVCFLSVGLPLFQLASVSRTWIELPGAIAAGQAAIRNSVVLAAASATAVLAIALAAGALGNGSLPSRLSEWSPWQRTAAGVFRFGVWLPFLVPGVLLGIGLIVVFNRPVLAAFYHSEGIVLLALVIRYFAPGRTPVAHGLQATDRDLADAARLEGASRWQVLRYVHLPQIAPQAAAAWYIVFLLCLWDVESMVLIVPPGGETLALRIFNLLHYGHNPQVNALCLTLLALAVVPLLAWSVAAAVARRHAIS
jgi:iron(III) transport system permease protein